MVSPAGQEGCFQAGKKERSEIMRKVFVLFLVLTCFLTLAMPAFAADSDYLPLRLQSVENETYGALDSLKMTGTSKTKRCV